MGRPPSGSHTCWAEWCWTDSWRRPIVARRSNHASRTATRHGPPASLTSVRMGAAARAGTVRGSSWPSLLEIFDRWWWLLVAALVPFFVHLNADAVSMQGLYPNYLCFRRAILHGLDPAANPCQGPTFPIWGYGWLLVITRTKAALLVFQGLAGLAAAWFLLRTLLETGLLGGWGLRLSKLLLLVCIPWYAFHALRWPYSEASTLVVFSVAVLCLVLRRKSRSFGLTAFSGILFGFALNLPFRLHRAAAGRRARCAHHVPRIPAAPSEAPWRLARSDPGSTRALDGVLGPRNRPRSTHVDECWSRALHQPGPVPKNPRGITASDSDPRMHRELDAHFHHSATSSLNYASDQFLRHRFVQLVVSIPPHGCTRTSSTRRARSPGASTMANSTSGEAAASVTYCCI
jgi:hypothetical protein